jgi:hypothetical protein
VTRIGLLPRQGIANLWFLVTRDGVLLHDATQLSLPLPAGDIDSDLSVGSLTYRCDEPLTRWRLRFADPRETMDVVWEAFSPVHQWPFPPESSVEDVPRHIEQRWVRGVVTIGDEQVKLERAYGHRDHSWGGGAIGKMHRGSTPRGSRPRPRSTPWWFTPDAFITVGACGMVARRCTRLDVTCAIDAAIDIPVVSCAARRERSRLALEGTVPRTAGHDRADASTTRSPSGEAGSTGWHHRVRPAGIARCASRVGRRLNLSREGTGDGASGRAPPPPARPGSAVRGFRMTCTGISAMRPA